MYKNFQISSSIFNSQINARHERIHSINVNHNSKSCNIFISQNPFNPKYQCFIHKINYSLFCATCDKDICSFCIKNHKNHKLYDSKNFIPTEKEIYSLKKTIKKYYHDYNLLLTELNFWKKTLDKKIIFFIQNIRNFNSNDDINFVDEFDMNNTSFYESMKFRKIYSCVMPKRENETAENNKILNTLCQSDLIQNYKPFYNNQDFLLSKNALNELISSNDDINNSKKFLSCSSLIINYITEFNQKCQNFLKKAEKNYGKNNKIYRRNTFSGRLNMATKYLDEDYKSNYENNDKKIIEKYIDFREYYSQNPRNKLQSLNPISSFLSNTPKVQPLKSILKNRNKQRNSLKTSYTSYGLLINNFESILLASGFILLLL